MSASTLRVTLFAALALALSPSDGFAQGAPGVPGDLFTNNYDLQLFEPFDLDLDNIPVRSESGYFFRYDKLYWAPSSERTTVGVPGQTFTSEVIFANTPNSEGTPPVTYNVVNDIQDAPPQSEFGWGDRIEFGYTDQRGVTLQIGILDGPIFSSEETFGFAGGAPLGFGSVHVNFASSDPTVNVTDLLTGFRDFGVQGDIDADGGDTAEAPIEVVVTGPGGIADNESDNIDGDETGAVFFVTVGGVLVFGYDFDDLHQFNLRFVNPTVRSVMETQGVELMKGFALDNRNKLRRRQNNRWNIGYGFRLLRIKDDFFFGGVADLGQLGNWSVNTDIDNQLIGPQVRANWTNTRGAWTFGVDTRFMAAVNFQDAGLRGIVAGGTAPGALNNSAVLQPTTTAVGNRTEDFSPLVELRIDAKYNLTKAIALRAGYTALFVDNVTRASQVVGYTLPNYTLLETGQQDIFLNGLSFGIDARY